jgi:hypothetical protein
VISLINRAPLPATQVSAFFSAGNQKAGNDLTYRRCASAAKGATESVTELLGRRGGNASEGAGGRCSRVPKSGASSTPMPKETNLFSAHMDSSKRCWWELSTFTGNVWKLRNIQSRYNRCANEGFKYRGPRGVSTRRTPKESFSSHMGYVFSDFLSLMQAAGVIQSPRIIAPELMQ